MKTLVVYYSRSGRTRRVAERLAQALDGRAVAITEAGSRDGVLGYLRSLWGGLLGREAAVDKLRLDPAAFDLVVIGTPVWGWHLSSPVRAFARRHARRIKRTAFFCTMGGSGAEAAFAELQSLLGRKPLATLALSADDFDHQAAALGRIRRFAQGLRELPAPPDTQAA